MKKVLMVLGGLLLVGVVCVAGLLAWVSVAGKEYDRQSRQYVLDSAPAICASFDLPVFLNHASIDLLKATPPEELAKVLGWFKRLGAFKGLGEVTGESNILVNTTEGKLVTAKYKAKAAFEAGPATLEIGLVNRGGVWKYSLFKIDAPAFAPQ